ncbi:MAG: mechanosensitive ion channel [Rhodocyclales bacterium]|nr:mechanosensitive ion channel [Rhodocyclales bacterium]
MAAELSDVWQEILSELQHPDIVWQVLVLAVCLLLARFIEGRVRDRVAHSAAAVAAEGRAWLLGGSLKRVIFPLAALLLVLLARLLLKSQIHIHLLNLALPLLASLAVIRLVVYILRHSFGNAPWLASFERGFATFAWGIVALHIIGLLPEVIDMLEAAALPLGKTQITLWQMLQAVVMVAATLLGALWLSNTFEARLNQAAGMDSNFRIVLARLSRTLLTLVAVLIALPLVGLDLTTLSVFGGALGVGLGFGLQKIASNYVSGFIILLDRSIQLGNVISVGSDRGEVTRITTRYTVLRNPGGIEALVPNELLIGSVVQNESYSDRKVRFALSVQVSYDSDLDLAMRLMIAAAAAQARVLAEPAPIVLLKEFAASGINLELGGWIADPESSQGDLRSTINLAIWRAFKQHGISIPFPQYEVRLLNPPSGEKNV